MADKIGPLARQDSVLGRFQVGHLRGAGHDAAVGIDFSAGKHADHSRGRLGHVGFDAADFGMGVRAAEKGGVEHSRQREIIHVSTDALDEARVLDTFH